jgi:hypothetical protein
VSLGGLLAVVVIQLAALLAPLGAGLTGVISGEAAGFASITAWFFLGVPVSYAFVDRSPAARVRKEERSLSPRPRTHLVISRTPIAEAGRSLDTFTQPVGLSASPR